MVMTQFVSEPKSNPVSSTLPMLDNLQHSSKSLGLALLSLSQEWHGSCGYYYSSIDGVLACAKATL